MVSVEFIAFSITAVLMFLCFTGIIFKSARNHLQEEGAFDESPEAKIVRLHGKNASFPPSTTSHNCHDDDDDEEQCASAATSAIPSCDVLPCVTYPVSCAETFATVADTTSTSTTSTMHGSTGGMAASSSPDVVGGGACATTSEM